jgi:hypothetical protein
VSGVERDVGALERILIGAVWTDAEWLTIAMELVPGTQVSSEGETQAAGEKAEFKIYPAAHPALLSAELPHGVADDA